MLTVGYNNTTHAFEFTILMHSASFDLSEESFIQEMIHNHCEQEWFEKHNNSALAPL